MDLRPGVKLRSAVCDAEVIVVKAPSEPVSVCCGGAPMVEASAPADTDGVVDTAFTGPLLIGKRYVLDSVGLELLCTKPGAGALSVDGEVLEVRGAKPLPSSD